MQITNLRPVGAGAVFDIQLLPTVRLLNWTAKHAKDRIKVFPPTPRHGAPTAIVAPETMTEIAALVAAELGGNRPDVASR
ncbi:MAG: hypothetical protein ABS75_18460 [Pelagibacterium sp. SCN 63-23]|nr:MAG: hypothetical protein ABS75_18460 [Pelagibacterium sp. SCN 63-23]